MDRRFLATLALRLLGIYVLLQGVFSLGFAAVQVVEWLRGNEPTPAAGLLGWGAPALGLLIAAAVLIVYAPGLAARLVGRHEAETETPPPTRKAIEIVGYRLLGVYALITSVPSLLGNILGDLFELEGWPHGLLTRDALTSFVGVVIGLWLLLAAGGLARFIDRIRGAGLQDAEQAWKSPHR